MEYKIGSFYVHKNRGCCEFTDQCKYLQDLNPDPSSVYMYLIHENKMFEFSKNCIEEF